MFQNAQPSINNSGQVGILFTPDTVLRYCYDSGSELDLRFVCDDPLERFVAASVYQRTDRAPTIEFESAGSWHPSRCR